ncbi:hypothetical protein C8R46DRAFT_1359762 [Mycena filopes]|nr:hypothetical protein C8R46DRAFT_1359762 [Mycena filopes]
MQLCLWIRRRLRLPARSKLSSGIATENLRPAPSLDSKSTATEAILPALDPKSPVSDFVAPKTALNGLIFALTTLSTVSKNIPAGKVLSAVIDPLLAITKRLEQSSANAKGFVALSTRLDLIRPMVSQMTKSELEPHQKVVLDALEGVLKSITSELAAVSTQKQLSQFFNSEDNTSSIAKHNTTLTQIIVDATYYGVQVTLRNLERMRLEQSSRAEGPNAPKLKTFGGGIGGAGGLALGGVGGKGGVGDAPQVRSSFAMEYPGNIGGGQGGPGGAGQQGGDGGLGRAASLTEHFKGWQSIDVKVMTTSITDFCTEYKINEKAQARLGREGYNTVGALFDEDLADHLTKAGFARGQIPQIINSAVHFIKANTAENV